MIVHLKYIKWNRYCQNVWHWKKKKQFFHCEKYIHFFHLTAICNQKMTIFSFRLQKTISSESGNWKSRVLQNPRKRINPRQNEISVSEPQQSLRKWIICIFAKLPKISSQCHGSLKQTPSLKFLYSFPH